MTETEENLIHNIVNKFLAANPKNALDIRAIGLELKRLRSGLYRDVYRIEGVPLVVKIPIHQDEDCLGHAQGEAKVVRRVNRFKKYTRLRKYMPKIYYFDQESGITVMHFYSKIRAKYKYVIAELITDIVSLVWPDGKIHDCDIHEENIGLDEHGNPKIIDLGYFSDLGRHE